jgi:hypothetical protein
MRPNEQSRRLSKVPEFIESNALYQVLIFAQTLTLVSRVAGFPSRICKKASQMHVSMSAKIAMSQKGARGRFALFRPFVASFGVGSF